MEDELTGASADAERQGRAEPEAEPVAEAEPEAAEPDEADPEAAEPAAGEGGGGETASTREPAGSQGRASLRMRSPPVRPVATCSVEPVSRSIVMVTSLMRLSAP